MPPRPVLVGLLLLAVVPPLLLRALGSAVGSFGMFTRIERYHLEVFVRGAAGEQTLRLSSLAPHLSRDARRILLPAEGYAFGADQVELVAGGIDDVARLACKLSPRAAAARVEFHRGAMNAKMAVTSFELACRAER